MCVQTRSEQFQTTIDAIPQPILVFDSHLKVCAANSALLTWLNRPLTDLCGCSLSCLMPEAHAIPLVPAADTVYNVDLALLGHSVRVFSLRPIADTDCSLMVLHATPLHTETVRDKIIQKFNLVVQSGQELSSTFDPNLIFERLYTILSGSMDCTTFLLSSYSADDQLIRCLHARHEGELLDLSVFPAIPLQRDNPHATQSLAIDTGKSLLINDFVAHTSGKTPTMYVDQDSKVYDGTDDEEDYTRSALIVPMRLDNQVVGVIQVQSYKLNAYTEDDLRFLEALAPQIAIVLQNASLHQRLQRYAAELEDRVAQRTHALEQALVNEKQLTEMKARFTSMLSHEFRNPLAGIQSALDLINLYGHRMTPEQQKERLQQIQAQVDRLKDMTEEVLFISRSDTVAVQLRLEAVDPFMLCQIIVNEMQPITPDHRLNLTLNGVPRAVLLDVKLCQQAISNLISNAVKYSPGRDHVDIAVTLDEKELCIAVCDSGIGIPEAELPHLFDTFYRASNVGGIAGTGLGLVVAKRAVEAHDGHLEVESHPDAGTIFRICLPARTA
ncbi:MAG: GAF domain-containing protein [Anaerolineae bacterium]|nr:GAF domain-containing protein [Anaerolineae bacterium]